MTTRREFFLAASLLLPGGAALAQAGMPVVLAIGASNTFGRGRGATPDGVPVGQAFPAQLQKLLSAQGIKARVQNAGIAGDTTTGMLGRLPRLLTAQTKVCIIQPGGNDRRRGIDRSLTAENISAMRALCQAKGIKVLMLESLPRIAGTENLLPDGQHYNVAGHVAMAQYLLSSVVSALR